MKKLFILLLLLANAPIYAASVRIINKTDKHLSVETRYRTALCPAKTTPVRPNVTQGIANFGCNLIGVKAFVIIDGEKYGTVISGKDKNPNENNFYFGPLGSPGSHTFELRGPNKDGVYELEQK
jgi:hypothetical protein